SGEVIMRLIMTVNVSSTIRENEAITSREIVISSWQLGHNPTQDRSRFKDHRGSSLCNPSDDQVYGLVQRSKNDIQYSFAKCFQNHTLIRSSDIPPSVISPATWKCARQ